MRNFYHHREKMNAIPVVRSFVIFKMGLYACKHALPLLLRKGTNKLHCIFTSVTFALGVIGVTF